MDQLSTELVWQVLRDTVQQWSYPEEIPWQGSEVVNYLQSLANVYKFRQHFIHAASSGFTLGLKILVKSDRSRQLAEPSPYNNGPISTLEAALHGAAAEGRNGALRFLIHEGVAVKTSCPPHGYIPLWLAAHSGYCSTVELLLDAGAPINSTASSEGRTALFGALAPTTTETLSRGDLYTNSRTILTFLLGKGADPQIRDAKGRRALHYAAIYGLPQAVDVLVSSGAPLEDCGDDETLLIMACEGHHLFLVRYLLGLGVYIDRRDS
ncbi:MAG: hypothetical protein Q9213_007518 [Squamulea squamosa]